MSYDNPTYSAFNGEGTIAGDSSHSLLSGVPSEQLLAELTHRQKTQSENAQKYFKAQEEISNLKDLLCKYVLRNSELEALNEKLEALLKDKPVQYNEPRFHYAINPRLWKYKSTGKYVPVKSVEKLCDQLFELTQTKDKNGEYLVKHQKDIVPIFLILNQSVVLPFTYCGKLPDFEFFWNDNIANRITDEQRRKSLTCNQNTFRVTKYGDIWGGVAITSWARLCLEGGNSNEYRVGAVLKDKIESMTF